jgi:hypothetical protein
LLRIRTSFKDSKQKSDTARTSSSLDKGGTQGTYAKAQRRQGQKPSWAYVLAEDSAWNLKQDIRDVKDGQNLVVIVCLELEISRHASDSGVSWDSQTLRQGRMMLGFISPMLALSMKQKR